MEVLNEAPVDRVMTMFSISYGEGHFWPFSSWKSWDDPDREMADSAIY